MPVSPEAQASAFAALTGRLSPACAADVSDSFHADPTVDGGPHDDLHRRISAAVRHQRTVVTGLPIHAGACVLPDGTGVLAIGPTGSGKSTFVLSLALRRRASIVSDDTVFYASRSVQGLGTPVALRRTSPFRSRAVEVWGHDPEGRLLVMPDQMGAPAMSSSAPVDVVVFPSFGADPAAERLGPAFALCVLSESFLRPATPDELLGVAQLVADAPVVRLSYRSVDEMLLVLDEFDRSIVPGGARPRLLTSDEVAHSGLHEQVTGVQFGDDVVLVHPTAQRTVLLHGVPETHSWSATDSHELAALGFARGSAG